MFNQLNRNIRKYFGISRTEANGILVLMILMTLIILIPAMFRNFGYKGYRNYEKDLALMDSFAAMIPVTVQQDTGMDTTFQVKLTYFDPNEITFNQMIRIGFDTIISKRVLAYRNKGGRFYRETDLLKIYDFPPALYERIMPFILIKKEKVIATEPDTGSAVEARYIKETQENIRFDLNEADTLQLSLVRGIGPVLSGRIVRYRELLGGFIEPDQLDEVYGLKENALENLKKAAYISPGFQPVRIRVNFSEWKDLVRHPYIPSELANLILNNRSVEGPFADGDNLAQRIELPDSLGSKILPYLEF